MQSDTSVHEIADGIYRIATPVRFPGGAEFSFNQYLVVDEMPLLFHTGLRRIFPQVREAVGRVLPVERLRYIGFSHFEADECGSLNEWLAVAPEAVPLCGRIAAGTSINDVADRAPRVLGDAASLPLGRSTVRWLDTPHLPHAWECGMLYEERTRTLLCSDLFTQGGLDHGRFSSAWPHSSRSLWPACMAARGGATAPACCGRSVTFSIGSEKPKSAESRFEVESSSDGW